MTRRASLAILALSGLACWEQGPIYGTSVEQDTAQLELTSELRKRSFHVTMCWEGPVKRPEVYLSALVEQTSGPVGVEWRISSNTEFDLIESDASSHEFVDWSGNPEGACTDGTTISFSLPWPLNGPATVEWGVGGSVFSEKDQRADDLELVLLVEEL